MPYRLLINPQKRDIDIQALIRFLERSIEQERTVVEANKELHNPCSYIPLDYELTHAELFLIRLRGYRP